MMKAIYLTILCTLFAIGAHAQYTDNPYDTEPVLPNKRIVANQIKTEKEYTFLLSGKGLKDSALVWTKQFAYNSLHQLIEWQLKTEGSKTITSRKYQYDKTGSLARYVDISLKGTKKDSAVYIMQGDTTGNLKFIYRLNKGIDELRTVEYLYNSKKQRISSMISINDSAPFTDRAFIYNEEGDLSGLYFMDERGNETASYSFYYDHAAKKRVVYRSNNVGKILFEAYTYNINNDLIRKEHFNNAGYKGIEDAKPDEVTKYYYDDRGLLAIETTYLNNELTNYIKHIYSN